MRVVALISGGKDSCYNMMQCVAAGHEIVALANIQPKGKDELDSLMFQTVGHEGIEIYAKAMKLPLYQRETRGQAITKDLVYSQTFDDEVEDLYQLLKTVKEQCKIQGVSVGAVLSDYQRLRVEDVCSRLNLTSLAYLWYRNQRELLHEMIDSGVKAILIKVAALALVLLDVVWFFNSWHSSGLNPQEHLGKTLSELCHHLCDLEERYGVNVCGEGGEYESFTLDCPLFYQEIVIEESEICMHSNDAFAPVGYLKLKKLILKDKPNSLSLQKATSPLLTEVDKTSSTPDTFKLDIRTAHCSYKDFKCDNGYTWLVRTGDESLESAAHQTQKLFTQLEGDIQALDSTFSNVVLVYLYVHNMRDYTDINDIYGKYFVAKPPARVSIQSSLPPGVLLKFELLLYNGEAGCKSMHIQSVSHWAPANIGPYSQAYMVSNMIYLAGQIGLIPATMQLDDENQQASRSLSHVQKVLRATGVELESTLLGVCYYTTEQAAWSAKKALRQLFIEHDTKFRCPVSFIKVQGLPRNACVEWHFCAFNSTYKPICSSEICIIDKMLVLIEELWCAPEVVGSWVATVVPLQLYEELPNIPTAIQTGCQKISHMIRLRGVQLSTVNLVRLFVPLSEQLQSTLMDAYNVLEQSYPSVPLSIVPIEGFYDSTCPLVLQAYTTGKFIADVIDSAFAV